MYILTCLLTKTYSCKQTHDTRTDTSTPLPDHVFILSVPCVHFLVPCDQNLITLITYFLKVSRFRPMLKWDKNGRKFPLHITTPTNGVCVCVYVCVCERVCY